MACWAGAGLLHNLLLLVLGAAGLLGRALDVEPDAKAGYVVGLAQAVY